MCLARLLTRSFALMLAGAVLAPPAAAQDAPSPRETARALERSSSPLPDARPRGAAVLYDQSDGLGSSQGYGLSENFETANDGADSYLAVDFTVPEDSVWTVDEVQVPHFYGVAEGGRYVPAPHFNLVLWADDGGRPGDAAYRADSVEASSVPPPEPLVLDLLALDLPEPTALAPGRYWLTVQANLDFSANGTRYFWYSRTEAVGRPAQLYNYGGGFTDLGPCATAWGDLNSTECGAGPDDHPELTFALLGTATAGAVSAEDGAAPPAFALLPAYPNPVAGSATIAYELPRAASVTLEVYDALGRRVATLAEEAKAAGRHTARWDATGLPAGLYFYRLRAGDTTQTRKAVVAR